jgi:segregation and condensation protein A
MVTMTPVTVEVSTPVFEGPFDLLLHLILREQVDLYEVSLTSIVDAYLRTLALMEDLDLDVATEFLLIASTLVDLKARRLLPGLDDGDLDDELALWEERDLLLARLLECKTFKDAALVLSGLHEVAGRRYARTCGPDDRFVDLMPDALAGITPDRLRAAFITATTPKPVPKVDLFHVAPIRASVVDAVAELVDELPRVGRITFRDLTAAFVEKLEIVVRFLAVLELFKQGLVDLDQSENFGDIEIVWGGADPTTAAEMALVDAYEG